MQQDSQQHEKEPMAPEARSGQLIKMGVDLGPLIAFFIAYKFWDIYVATGTLMITTIIALVVSRAFLGKIPVMPLVTGVIVMVFGGLTIWLQDENFIKLKPTIVYALFSAALAGGLMFKQSFIKVMFGEVFKLTETGWRELTIRWALFFAAMAILNEIVARGFSTDVWVSFKLFGFMPLTMIFAIFQMGLLKRHAAEPDAKITD